MAKEGLSISHPRLRTNVHAHEAAEKDFIARWQRGAVPHALLITGPEGIGKSAFAYQIARFLLTHPAKPAAGLFGDVESFALAMRDDHPVFKRVAAGGHSDLLAIEPAYDERKGEYKREIPVDTVRRIGSFLSLTPGESAWRIVIIDSIDQLNRNAANAVLKVLEEPPAQAILLLVSHNPSALLPTIRSRCQRMTLQPPQPPIFAAILREHDPHIPLESIEALYRLSQGSPGLALRLYQEEALLYYARLIELLGSGLPLPDVQAFSDRLAGKSATISWQAVSLLFETLLLRVIKTKEGILSDPLVEGEDVAIARVARANPLDYWLKLWEKSRALLVDTERLHLDPRQTILHVLQGFHGTSRP